MPASDTARLDSALQRLRRAYLSRLAHRLRVSVNPAELDMLLVTHDNDHDTFAALERRQVATAPEPEIASPREPSERVGWRRWLRDRLGLRG